MIDTLIKLIGLVLIAFDLWIFYQFIPTFKKWYINTTFWIAVMHILVLFYFVVT